MIRKLAVTAVFVGALIGQRAAGQVLTTECTYVRGPQAGQTQNFAGYPPIPLGSACNDGAGSVGIGTPPGDSHPRGVFSMAGGQPSCTDILGTAVPYQAAVVPQPKAGWAHIVGNMPVITIMQSLLANVPAPAVTFLYAHECGHHALGQVIGGAQNIPIDINGELAADCFAKQSIVGAGLLSPAQLQTTYQYIATVPGDPVTYPGPIRVQMIQAC